jgi:hypothetical protein
MHAKADRETIRRVLETPSVKCQVPNANVERYKVYKYLRPSDVASALHTSVAEGLLSL